MTAVAAPLLVNTTLNQKPLSLDAHLALSTSPLSICKVQAGFPSPASDYTEDALDLNQYLIKHKAASFMFSVEGQSMRDAGIVDGDKVAVDRSIEAKHNHIVIAVFEGDYTIKRLYKQYECRLHIGLGLRVHDTLLHSSEREEERVVLVQVADGELHDVFPLRVERCECLEVGRHEETRLVRGNPRIFLRYQNRLHRRYGVEEIEAERLKINLGLEECAAFLFRQIHPACAFQPRDGRLRQTKAV